MRIRAAYSVGPDLRFLGNFDMMHLMERALRRADIAYSLTEGYNPHIKLSMGTILPVGVWGQAELFDLELEAGEPEDFMLRMNQVLPEGMKIQDCREIPEDAPSLMKVINVSAYTFHTDLPLEQVEQVIAEILSRSTIPIQSRGKKKDKIKDLRPGIFSVKAEQINAKVSSITLLVSVNEPFNIRYDELLDMLDDFGIKRETVVDYFRQANYIREKERLYSPLNSQQVKSVN